MLAAEIAAMGRLAGEAISGPAGLARDVHRAAAGRVFGTLGILGAPARFGHDAISALTYRTVHQGIGALPRGGGRALAQLASPQARPLGQSTGGSLGLGVLNGAIGDRLAEARDELALEMTIRHRGLELPQDPEELRSQLPGATGRIAIFVHGLCETDAAWHLLPLAGRKGDRRSYGARLREEHGYTPLYVRYNTGLHISDNGRRMAELLEALAEAWPARLEEITLIGHSMGGLVSRSACHYGERHEHRWVGEVRHVICLGTPHLGAPLERVANVAGWTLGRLRETRPFADLVNGRSAGIKDLRYGACVEEDWHGHDPDEYLTDRCREVPFLDGADHYFVGATVTRDPEHPVGRIAGDVLVQYSSASGSGSRRRIPFEIDNGHHLGGAHHIELLNHPAVYEQIRTWIQRRDRPVQQMR